MVSRKVNKQDFIRLCMRKGYSFKEFETDFKSENIPNPKEVYKLVEEYDSWCGTGKVADSHRYNDVVTKLHSLSDMAAGDHFMPVRVSLFHALARLKRLEKRSDVNTIIQDLRISLMDIDPERGFGARQARPDYEINEETRKKLCRQIQNTAYRTAKIAKTLGILEKEDLSWLNNLANNANSYLERNVLSSSKSSKTPNLTSKLAPAPIALTLIGFGGALGSFLYNQSSMTSAAIGVSSNSPMEFFGLAFFLIGCLGVFMWRRK